MRRLGSRVGVQHLPVRQPMTKRQDKDSELIRQAEDAEDKSRRDKPDYR